VQASGIGSVTCPVKFATVRTDLSHDHYHRYQEDVALQSHDTQIGRTRRSHMCTCIGNG